MAIAPLGADSALVTHPRTLPPAPAVMRLLSRFNRDELGNAIEVLVALLDIWDGDPDEEPNGDDEPLEANGDTRDAAWMEWHTMRGSQKRGPNVASENEDDEEDDPPEEDDPQGECSEDEISCGPGNWGGLYSDFRQVGPGCTISDAGIADDGALAEAHGILSGPSYGVDQTRPLGAGHEP